MTILTDGEIAKAGKDCFWPLDEDAPKFARAIEADRQRVPEGWIALSDRRPEQEVYVLAWDGKKVSIDWWGSLPKPHGTEYTHWMPFPKPPGAGDRSMYGMHSLAAAPEAPAQAEQAAEPVRDEREKELVWLCAEAYQVVASMLHDLKALDTEKANKILDNLSQAKFVHDDVLPWPQLAPAQASAVDERAAFEAELRHLHALNDKLTKAYRKMYNAAAGYSNYCEDSASVRRCERDFEEADAMFRAALAQEKTK